MVSCQQSDNMAYHQESGKRCLTNTVCQKTLYWTVVIFRLLLSLTRIKTSLLFFQVRQRRGKCEGCTFHGADNGGEQELSHYRQKCSQPAVRTSKLIVCLTFFFFFTHAIVIKQMVSEHNWLVFTVSYSIERLWRDVYENVLDLFYTIFTQLEIQGLLNPGEEIDLFALHRCFLHHIQHHLQSFQEAWNQHGLRTANNHSPLQLWLLHRKEGQDLSQVHDYLIRICSSM